MTKPVAEGVTGIKDLAFGRRLPILGQLASNVILCKNTILAKVQYFCYKLVLFKSPKSYYLKIIPPVSRFDGRGRFWQDILPFLDCKSTIN